VKILLLGGTRFLGRHIVEAALARGHEVTLFNRGRTNPGLFPQVETLIGDRDGDLQPLKGRRWDSAIDTSGRLPRIVRASATLLANSVDHYSFLSSVAVYEDRSAADVHEDSPVAQLNDESSEDVVADYAALKALCEREVEAAMPGRALNVRAGLLVGPWDDTARFTYWPWRIARGGEVLAPGRPDQPVQFIHARDLADWIVLMSEGGKTGTFNATGPEQPLTLAQFLETCREVTGGDARFIWIGEDFLLEREVIAFTELPLWLREGRDGLLAMNIDKALAAGLAFRPLAATIRETLDWHESLPADPDDAEARLYRVEGKAGLSPEREASLLAEWRALRHLP
jgi:2'-hydroxyisoflavone reductase